MGELIGLDGNNGLPPPPLPPRRTDALAGQGWSRKVFLHPPFLVRTRLGVASGHKGGRHAH